MKGKKFMFGSLFIIFGMIWILGVSDHQNIDSMNIYIPFSLIIIGIIILIIKLKYGDSDLDSIFLALLLICSSLLLALSMYVNGETLYYFYIPSGLIVIFGLFILTGKSLPRLNVNIINESDTTEVNKDSNHKE